MKSRMEKYNDPTYSTMSRTKRNSSIYSNMDMEDIKIKTGNNARVIADASKEIDMDKILKYINSMEEKKERVNITLDDYKDNEISPIKKEAKDYDINSVLSRARDNRNKDYSDEKYKKLDNSEYNILKNIKVEKEKNEEETNDIDLNTSEKTIVKLIDDLSKTKKMEKSELLGELMGDNENTVVLGAKDLEEEVNDLSNKIDEAKRPLEELTRDLMMENEKLKEMISENKKEENDEPSIKQIKIEEEPEEKRNEVDKSFFTNSLTFSKKDFEETDDLLDEEEGSSFYTKFAIFMIIIVLIATLVIIANYVFDLNLF